MHVTRRFTVTCAAIVLAGIALSVTRGLAHHGWDWAEGENFELTGVITAAQLGALLEGLDWRRVHSGRRPMAPQIAG